MSNNYITNNKQFATCQSYRVYPNGEIFNKHLLQVKPRLHKGKYDIQLNINGKRTYMSLARFVYWAYNPTFDIKDKNLCVTFKDGDKLNVNIDNLIVKHRKDLIQGDKHKKSKVTDKMAEKIRAEYKSKLCSNQHDKIKAIGVSYGDLAKKYDVSKSLIRMIIKGACRNKDRYKL